ncbi:HAMP domain-containing sensor histidine kinase [Aquamicrobium sp. LC103]|uniref:sensor histidine kinase n=1 Tax=Aquamicrobium sp. LC103 TaxID=1120658 RepID=UPI00069C82BC|nr:HAMP domain-containing sensor histidine kinase [Aquamicrobium sp. LC103]TKT82527.1 HAMP domain-containing histidine kinase [Aquamicrobium sp. LC103]
MQVLPRVPVTVRLPLAAAAMIFIAAVASTQIAISFMGRQADRQVETLGQVYLDGLSAALLPHVSESDEAGIRQTLQQALAFHQGVVDRRLAFLDAAGDTVADISRQGIETQAAMPVEVEQTANGMLRTEGGDVWIWRELADENGSLGTVAANLDMSSFEDGRGMLRWLLLLFDLLFSSVCAVIGFFMVRRIQAPVTTIATHLYEAALGMLRPIDEKAIPAGDRQTERMFHAFNAMAHAAHEREALLSHLAGQEREAVLGRLTATIAHEVRNPLGGMRTAVSTLKRFGDRPDTRAEAVGFLERGVQTLEEVVNATLESHRARPEWRPLSRKDFDDLRLLVEADGRSRDVSVELDTDIADEIPVAALEVRQVLLNLLLNAVRASSPGSRVRLAASTEKGELVVNVRDEGAGLDPKLAHAMESGEMVENPAGLGVSVVIRLVERLQGRVAIESRKGLGTSITLRFPLQKVGNQS